jgi:hypothetical protein
MSKIIDEESVEPEPERKGRGEVVRVTIVMPPTMYDDLKSGADDNRQLVGEHIRDLLRDALDREDDEDEDEDEE